MPETFVDEKGRTRYIAPCCGTELSKSGYYKHMSKPCPHNKNSKRENNDSTSSPKPPTIDIESTKDTPAPQEPSWLNWDPEITNDATESIPSPLKYIASKGRIEGSSKEDLEALMAQSRAILCLGLTAWDGLSTKYARAITEDPEYVISHSESDKMLVADAQARWLESRGLLVAEIVGEGTLALALTSWYALPPLAKAHRKAKRGFISPVTKGKTVLFLSKIPLVGRLFRRKPKKNIPEVTENEENV